MTTGPSALVFDVFGTVVDWRSTIIREGEELGRENGLRTAYVPWSPAPEGAPSRPIPPSTSSPATSSN